MKTTFAVFVLAAALSATGTLSAQVATGREGSDEQQIRKIEQDWLEAIQKRDASYLEKIEAPDFIVTGPEGRTLNKSGDIKDTTSGETNFEQMTIDHLNVRIHGDTAIANGVATVKARTKERDESGQFAWTDVFIRVHGEWKAVSAQVTPIPNSPEEKPAPNEKQHE
ncbi:MAG TPA: nuclear transport factor 2 family protein [Chthoniobacterales bacterium]